jgi:hypothetical protein
MPGNNIESLTFKVNVQVYYVNRVSVKNAVFNRFDNKQSKNFFADDYLRIRPVVPPLVFSNLQGGTMDLFGPRYIDIEVNWKRGQDPVFKLSQTMRPLLF